MKKVCYAGVFIVCIVFFQVIGDRNLMAMNGDFNGNGKLGLEDCVGILQRLTGVRSIEEEGSVKCGDSLPGIIDEPGESDDFTFYAWAGEVIVIAVENKSTSALFQPCWQLLDPSSEAISAIGENSWATSYCETYKSYILPSDGPFTIRVYDNEQNATGNYNIRLEAVSAYFNGKLNCAQSIDCGDTKYSVLESNYSADSYRFSANAGEVIAIVVENRSTSALFQACWQLVDPSAEAISAIGENSWVTSYCETNKSYKLPSNGPFTIRVYDKSRDGKGEYSIRLEPVSAYFNGQMSCAQLIEYGKTESDTLESNHAINSYMFFEQAGEVVEISVTNKSTSVLFEPCWQLLDISSEAISAIGENSWVTNFCETTKSYNIPKDGYFIIRIYDDNQDGKGEYEISLKKL